MRRLSGTLFKCSVDTAWPSAPSTQSLDTPDRVIGQVVVWTLRRSTDEAGFAAEVVPSACETGAPGFVCTKLVGARVWNDAIERVDDSGLLERSSTVLADRRTRRDSLVVGPWPKRFSSKKLLGIDGGRGATHHEVDRQIGAQKWALSAAAAFERSSAQI